MRYITTLQNKIDNLPSGSLKTNAEVWLGDFKTWIGYYNESVYDEGGDIDGIQIVITSYSIHYTKLYEITSPTRLAT